MNQESEWLDRLLAVGAADKARLLAQQNPRIINAMHQFGLAVLRKTDESVTAWADRALALLVVQTKALQGALYLREAIGLTLHLTGTYAGNDDNLLSIEFGQGLAGQVLAEGHSVLLPLSADDTHDSRIAMGAIRPNNLLLLPLMHQGLAEGMLQLTFVTPPTDEWQHLLTECGNRVAQAWQTIRHQEDVARLQATVTEQNVRLHRLQVELRIVQEELEASRHTEAEARTDAADLERELDCADAELALRQQLINELRRALRIAPVFHAAA